MPENISRNTIQQCLRRAGQPLSFAALCEQLEISEKADKQQVTRTLRELEDAGAVLQNRKGAYGLVEQMDLLRGVVLGHADGYGFLKTDSPGPDWFLPPRQMDRVFPGDRVLARSAGPDRRGREQASIVEVLERHTHELVGRFRMEAGVSWVVPENAQACHHLLVAPEDRNGASDGELVRVSVQRQPDRDLQPIGRVEEVLGRHVTASMRVDIAITDFGLPREFPPELSPELKDLPAPRLDADCEDARDIPFVTIDGADAKDFDDALHAKATRQGWRLSVAIADVSRYVRPGTRLDDEARERATSAYFPGRVVPMLPPVLSDDLCSLRPDDDRHALVCEMVISRQGELRSTKFYPALIRSQARLIYEDVAGVLESGDRHPQAKSLKVLNEVFEVLYAARQERGALDFEGREVNLELDENGAVKAVHPVERTRAHRLVEECMIMANVAAARYLRRHRIPALNRIHAPPPPDSVADFRAFLGEQGLQLKGQQEPTPKDYQAVLAEIAGQPQAPMVQGALLRTLSQAVYSPATIGHFGLALEDYAHFTSPIRRYPDLIVHRAIKHVLAGRRREEWPWDEEGLKALGEHCSQHERRADQAGWSVIEALKCEYLAAHVGEEFEGEVVGVTNFGLFVEISDVRASGLVHISSLGRDYFQFEPAYHRLRGKHSGQIFRLGDQLRVKLTRADAQERKIDFEPLAHKPVVSYRKGAKSSRTKWRAL